MPGNAGVSLAKQSDILCAGISQPAAYALIRCKISNAGEKYDTREISLGGHRRGVALRVAYAALSYPGCRILLSWRGDPGCRDKLHVK